MSRLTLVSVGSISQELLRELCSFLADRTKMKPRISETELDPSPAYTADRGQYNCRRLLPPLDLVARRTGGRVLGVADVDLYSPIFDFVFGEARLNGKTGIISLHRLRPDVYGLPPAPRILHARIRKEALHEIGHLLGLVHCWSPDCVMRFSGAAEEVDLKSDRFCAKCSKKLAEWLPAPLIEPGPATG